MIIFHQPHTISPPKIRGVPVSLPQAATKLRGSKLLRRGTKFTWWVALVNSVLHGSPEWLDMWNHQRQTKSGCHMLPYFLNFEVILSKNKDIIWFSCFKVMLKGCMCHGYHLSPTPSKGANEAFFFEAKTNPSQLKKEGTSTSFHACHLQYKSPK